MNTAGVLKQDSLTAARVLEQDSLNTARVLEQDSLTAARVLEQDSLNTDRVLRQDSLTAARVLEQDSLNIKKILEQDAKLLETVKILIDSIDSQMTNIQSSIQEIQKQHKIFVYVGREDTLKKQKYLEIPGSIRTDYKVINFPINDSSVYKVDISKPLSVQGKIAAVCDRHGKLSEGKDYTLSQGKPGQTLIFFSNATLVGEYILVVLED